MNQVANILLVDDEVRNLDVLESILTSPDYQLIRAQKAEDALLALLETDFAAIVLDIQMPGMSGIEFANLVKQRRRTAHVPIIFLTAHFQEDKDILHGYQVGAVDYLTKPINSKILKSKVAVFVDLFRKTHALAASNAALEIEIAERKSADEALRQANSQLEERVRERTADLSLAVTQLRESEARLSAALRAKDDFLATLSHELRTPLNPVLLLASEGASHPELPATVRADFAIIRKNVELEARLIDDLLDLTRIVRGKLSLQMNPQDVHAILRHTIGNMRGELDEKRIQLIADYGAGNCIVVGDDVRLQQVFWNVLKNAVKFTPEGGRVEVETRTSAELDKLSVKIRDTGIGMTVEEITRVFEAFSQGDHASKVGPHSFGGLGLGLAIARMLVELHKGTIRAFSSGRGHGATFVIDFPLLLAGDNPGSPKVVSPLTLRIENSDLLAPRRILLVEDHEPTRTTLRNLLARRGYIVKTASSVAEAHELARQGSFDILISDIGLPDGSGYDLMTKLGERGGLKGIALTGYGMDQDIARSQLAGFVAHLTKPVRVESLDSALAAATCE